MQQGAVGVHRDGMLRVRSARRPLGRPARGPGTARARMRDARTGGWTNSCQRSRSAGPRRRRRRRCATRPPARWRRNSQGRSGAGSDAGAPGEPVAEGAWTPDPDASAMWERCTTCGEGRVADPRPRPPGTRPHPRAPRSRGRAGRGSTSTGAPPARGSGTSATAPRPRRPGPEPVPARSVSRRRRRRGAVPPRVDPRRLPMAAPVRVDASPT